MANIIDYLSLTGLTNYDANIKAFIGEKVAEVNENFAESDKKSFKYVNLEGNTLKFYTVNPLGDNPVAVFEVQLPEQDLSDLMQLVKDATENNIAVFDANGQVKDGGLAVSDIATKAELGDIENKVGSLDTKIDAVGSKIGTMDNLATNAKGDLVAAINEVRASVSAGGTEAAISVDTSVTTEGFLKSYTFYQGETKVAVIDIPKDLFAVNGKVVENPDGQTEGTYIELTIQNGEPVYIDVASLVENYTAKANASQVQIAIDPDTREISAHIVDESIGTNALANDAVTTVKIVDGNVTLAKLSSTVQESLAKADNAASTEALETEKERASAAEEKMLIDAKAYTDSKIGTVDLSGIEENKKAISTLTQTHETDKSALEAKDTEIEGNVTALQEDVATLKETQYEEISKEQIDALFAKAE